METENRRLKRNVLAMERRPYYLSELLNPIGKPKENNIAIYIANELEQIIDGETYVYQTLAFNIDVTDWKQENVNELIEMLNKYNKIKNPIKMQILSSPKDISVCFLFHFVFNYLININKN